MPDITLERILVRHGETLALDDVSFTAPAGTITVVIGASGSGKTSLLRAVAGLDRLRAGRVSLGDRDVTSVPPDERDVALTFSDPALFGHRNVAGNIAMPLKFRNAPVDEIAARVGAEAHVLHIEELLEREVTELSVGEAQMVQVARALVRTPSVLLLDEPFAALEGERASLFRRELKWLQSEFATTTLMTSNNPDDVRQLADFVAVLERGRLTQFGTADDVVEHPRTVAAAQLTGDAEVMTVTVETDADGSWLVHPAFRVRAWQPALRRHTGRRVLMIVRPEWWQLDPHGRIGATVERRLHWNGATTLTAFSNDHRITARTTGTATDGPRVGDRVLLRLDRWVLIDPLDGFRLDLTV